MAVPSSRDELVVKEVTKGAMSKIVAQTSYTLRCGGSSVHRYTDVIRDIGSEESLCESLFIQQRAKAPSYVPQAGPHGL